MLRPIVLNILFRFYIKVSEERVESAKGEVEDCVIDVEDLEASETPER